MENTKKIASFVRQFVAAVKGDNVEVLAQKALRQADSALKTQISSLEGDTIAKEDRVTDVKEAQEAARINRGQPITDRNAYVRNLLDAKNNVTLAEEDLKTHKEKIAFLKGELDALNAEVDA